MYKKSKCEWEGKRKQRAILHGQGKALGLKCKSGEGGNASLSDDIAKCKSGFLEHSGGGSRGKKTGPISSGLGEVPWVMCMSGEKGDMSFHDGIAERAQTALGEFNCASLKEPWLKGTSGELGYESLSDDIAKCKGR